MPQLTRAARAAHRADQEHVDSLIRRLERARQALDALSTDFASLLTAFPQSLCFCADSALLVFK
jgi:hypothetical protein